jgi:beta-galactosidase
MKYFSTSIKKLALVHLMFLLANSLLHAQQQSIDISNLKWKIWLDEKAEWVNDQLFLSPQPITSIPVNKPTCGWQQLWDGRGKTVTLPANVEEHFWNNNGNGYGISGNYKGVSWFFSNVMIPSSFKGSKVLLHLESTRLRAEIFVNDQLVGYNLMNATSFDVDITSVANYGSQNKIAVRITDPDGNFEWMDLVPHTWGKYKIPPSHGFGGITGKVFLQAVPATFISDVFIKNKPSVTGVDVIAEHNQNATGTVQFQISEVKSPSVILVTKKLVVKNATTAMATFELPNAKKWDVHEPNLYLLTVTYKNNDGSFHKQQKKFGFRWFEVKDNNGDKQFFLNGKRIVIRTSISWGYWPVNGISPTYELAKKQITIAKQLGLNCLNFHRHMGQEMLLNLADEMGLLYYVEPGGYKTGIAGTFTANWNRERMLRMIKQFRSHPSLIIYNMINESTRDPLPHEYEDIRLFHQLDETRCITFTSTNFTPKYYNSKLDEAVEKPVKMHMLPYDTTVYFKGWWDEHYADGPGVYKDEFYKNSEQMLRGSNNKSEIVFWGEDGAIGTPERVELAAKSLSKLANNGWDGDDYMKQYNSWNGFLKEKQFTKAFPSVDSLQVSLGNNALYYQGRIIENIRISNITDGYVVNGWEGNKIENHSGIVDVWRNSKGNPQIMSYYNQPLYVAIKARQTVLKSGDLAVVDFFIVNEKNVNGTYTLEVNVVNAKGVFYKKSFTVCVTGGSVYGELLRENVSIPVMEEGYTTIHAKLIKQNIIIASGIEKLYAVDFPLQTLQSKIFVSDTSGTIQKTIHAAGIPFENVKGQFVPVNGVLVLSGSNMNFVKDNWRVNNDFIEWVSNGNTVICLDNCDLFAEFLEKKEVLDYYGRNEIGKVWYGGNYFNKEHSVFKGLPQNTAFNWEWQSLAGYDLKRYGLRLKGEQTLIGAHADHRQELFSVLAVVPVGRGQIILSTLDLHKAIGSAQKSSIVAKRLLLNLLLSYKQ